MIRNFAAALALAVLAVGACSGGISTPTEPALLPPHERDDLAALFDPMVESLGYQVTRASLIDRSTYQVDADGGHLAIYVAPTADVSSDQFAMDFPLLTSVFLPFVFDQWPELDSFDLCQEPFNSTDDTPPSLTVIDLTRDAAAAVAWGELGLTEIIALDSRQGISIWARMEVRNSATWSEAAGL